MTEYKQHTLTYVRKKKEKGELQYKGLLEYKWLTNVGLARAVVHSGGDSTKNKNNTMQLNIGLATWATCSY